jgi:outer membrane protein OmpA-like peptidoglycan-associated protein
MNRVLLASVALLGFGLSAAAQAQEWTGPYAGIQSGYGWGQSTGGLRVGGFAIPYDVVPTGVIGGAHLGYDWQSGHLVLGIVGDAEGADISGRDTRTNGQFMTHVANNFDASIRGKVGAAFDRIMVYGTGGVAFGNVKTEYSCPTCFRAPNAFDTINSTRVGWTAGAGASFLIDPKWSAGVEYRYTNLGGKTFAYSVTTASDSGNKFAFSAVQVSVSYHFWPHRHQMVEPEPIVPAMAPVPMPPAPVARQNAFIVFFDFDRYDLTQEAQAVVDQAAKSFRDNGYARIELNGYTDLAGTQEYNLKLSQRRATAVAEALAKLGVPRPAMNVMWHGKEHPRVPTPDGMRDPHNRRVEIVMP